MEHMEESVSPCQVNKQVKRKAAVPVSLELQLRVVQLVTATVSGSGSI